MWLCEVRKILILFLFLSLSIRYIILIPWLLPLQRLRPKNPQFVILIKIVLLAIRGSLTACLFLWCVHYIKIFMIMSFFHLCALNSVYERFFLDLKFEIFPLEFIKKQDLGFSCIQGWKISIFKSWKYQWRFPLVQAMIQCTTLKSFFVFKCLQFGTLY